MFGRNIPYTKYKDVKDLPFIRNGRYKSGFVFSRKEDRRKPFNQLAGRIIGIDRNDRRVEELLGITIRWN